MGLGKPAAAPYGFALVDGTMVRMRLDQQSHFHIAARPAASATASQ
jgi:hypothetical protein